MIPSIKVINNKKAADVFCENPCYWYNKGPHLNRTNNNGLCLCEKDGKDSPHAVDWCGETPAIKLMCNANKTLHSDDFTCWSGDLRPSENDSISDMNYCPYTVPGNLRLKYNPSLKKKKKGYFTFSQ